MNAEKPLIIERFAPSPTGLLHLGHAYSAKIGFNHAREHGGKWFLRIEDIDHTRSKPEYCAQILDDLKWLELNWDGEIIFQSQRLEAYEAALDQLKSMGVLYGCSCSRSDIKATISAPQEGVKTPPPYPGICRDKHLSGNNLAWRLDVMKAFELCPKLTYVETGDDRPREISITKSDLETIGDVVLARRDIGYSYHLCVVVDDNFQRITHVTRGRDIARETCIHVLLQKLLNFTTPTYHHHNLILNEDGKRLAKRENAKSIQSYRDQGLTPKNIWEILKISPNRPFSSSYFYDFEQ